MLRIYNGACLIDLQKYLRESNIFLKKKTEKLEGSVSNVYFVPKKPKKKTRSDSVLVGLGLSHLYFTTACNETGCLLKNQQITFILANNFSLFRSNLGTQSLSTEEKQFHPV
jgi:hypothetical protein